MDRKEILDKFSEGFNNIGLEKAKLYLNELIGKCNIYLQEELLNYRYEKIEEFLKDLLNSKEPVLSENLPINISNFTFMDLDGYKYLNYKSNDRIVTISKIGQSEIEQGENDINLYLIKNEPDKDYLYRKYKDYFEKSNEKNIFIVFDEFTPNLNKLFKKNIFAIPLTYKKNSGINHYIGSEILKINEEKIIKDFESYVNNSHERDILVKSEIDEISHQINIIVQYFKKIEVMVHYYYKKYQDIVYTEMHNENLNKQIIENETNSGTLSPYRIRKYFEEQGQNFKKNHNEIVANFSLDFALNLVHMINKLKLEQIDNRVIKDALQFSFKNIDKSKDYLKIIESYMVKENTKEQLSIMEQESIYRSVYDDINRNVVLNDVYSKINDEIMYKHILIPRLIAYKITNNIKENIFDPEIKKYTYNYWEVDMSNEIKKFFVNIYNYIFNDFKNKYTEFELKEIQDKFDEIFKFF